VIAHGVARQRHAAEAVLRPPAESDRRPLRRLSSSALPKADAATPVPHGLSAARLIAASQPSDDDERHIEAGAHAPRIEAVHQDRAGASDANVPVPFEGKLGVAQLDARRPGHRVGLVVETHRDPRHRLAPVATDDPLDLDVLPPAGLAVVDLDAPWPTDSTRVP
jgi:hypothetical protein